MKMLKFRVCVNRPLTVIVWLFILAINASCSYKAKPFRYNLSDLYQQEAKQKTCSFFIENPNSLHYEKQSSVATALYIPGDYFLEDSNEMVIDIRFESFNSWNEKTYESIDFKQVKYVSGLSYTHSFTLPVSFFYGNILKYEITGPSLKNRVNGIIGQFDQKHSKVESLSIEKAAEINWWGIAVKKGLNPVTDILKKANYFGFDTSLPQPPYIDQTDPINISNKSVEVTAIEKAGFYFFERTYYNRAVFVGTEHFPKVKRVDDLIEPLRYITTNEEYENLKTTGLSKLKVDSFWYALTGNFERGKKLIKEYYKRVEISNELFSDYREGWRTDRGMIYMVYGPPTEVFRHDDMEIWYDAHTDSRFIFNKESIHSDFEVYVLNRDKELKEGWAKAVSNWRNGYLSRTFD